MRNIFLFCYYLDNVRDIADKFVVMDKLRNLLGNRHTPANVVFSANTTQFIVGHTIQPWMKNYSIKR